MNCEHAALGRAVLALTRQQTAEAERTNLQRVVRLFH